MQNFISCEIIKDLLPNYIDNKLSSESNLLVKHHIDSCCSCKEEYEKMNTIIKADTVNIDSLDYLKKLNKHYIILLILTLAICAFSIIGITIYTEPNLEQAIFTLLFLIFACTLLLLKYILPLAIMIFSIFYFKKSKNKLLILPIILCNLWLLFFIFLKITDYIFY